eukprot:jgi/Tetstr1/445380/TSEL_003393.t1
MQTVRTFDQTTREERARAWATKRRLDILTCGDSDMLIQKADIHVPLEQSREYKGYCFLLTYIDHGIKFCFYTLIPNKEDAAILQADNAFHTAIQQVPYNALLGQLPHMGISNLPISNLHEDVLAPEKQAEEDEEEQQAEEQARQEQQAEEQARQEQQPQEEEDMDAFRTPAPLPIDLPITSGISVNAQHDEQMLSRNEN